MALLKKISRSTGKCYQRIRKRWHVELRDRAALKKMEKVSERRRLSKEQKREIREFYKGLTGKSVSTAWHQYFYSRTGVYSKEYMPVGLYEADILGRANRMDLYNSYVDKNLDELLLPGVRHPHTFLRNVRGYYYFEGEPVSKEEAVWLCQNLGSVVVKPSRQAIGEGVKVVDIRNGVTDMESMPLEALFDQYKEDFLIQEKIRQHERMAVLNPTSVNTIRILTFRSGMEILVVYTVVRIGREGSVIDNQSAGGISAKIGSDGRICRYAFGAVGDDRIEQTDTGIALDGYLVPSYEKAVEVVRRLHYKLPLFDLVGWDIAIGEDGEPLLIEWNGETGPSQTACGTGFGELTERIIKEVWPRKNTRYV